MRVMLTSCGLETKQIESAFLEMLGKDPENTKALFIPTAAIDPGAIQVLPKCLNDLLKVGIPERNITVYDLHRPKNTDELTDYNLIYFCGGRTQYLLDRIHDAGFEKPLADYIAHGGMVLGVSAGSLIFAGNLPGNLGLLNTKLSVHCEKGDAPGRLSFPLPAEMHLSNTGAILLRQVPEDAVLIDG